MLHPYTVRANRKGEIVIPFFRVGAPEYDLQAYLDLQANAAKRAG